MQYMVIKRGRNYGRTFMSKLLNSLERKKTRNDEINEMSIEEKAEWLCKHDDVTLKFGRLTKDQLIEWLSQEKRETPITKEEYNLVRTYFSILQTRMKERDKWRSNPQTELDLGYNFAVVQMTSEIQDILEDMKKEMKKGKNKT